MRIRVRAFLSAALLVGGTLYVHADNGKQVRDEWEPIDRIVVATGADKTLSPLAEAVIREAIKGGIKVVIVDDDAASQAAIKTRLKALGIITDKTEADVQFTNTPHNTSWARDEAPIARFKTTTGTADLTATLFAPEPSPPTPPPLPRSDQIVKDVGGTVRLPTTAVPTITFPQGTIPPSLPLSVDGGDWMTTDGGKTLVTTTEIYAKNGGTDAKPYVEKTLKDEFGVARVIVLDPIDPKAAGYDLSNAHVDLQVRTLPGKKAIVASVAETDPQYPILEKNARTLANAGYTVIRVSNAPPDATKAFKTYTNALFLNDTVVIPTYGDPVRDQAAKDAYEAALGAKYTVVQVDASEAIKSCGAARCAAREIPRVVSVPAGKEATSKSPLVSFDPVTGVLSITDDFISFLGDPGGAITDPLFAADPLLGATIEIGDMTLSTEMSAEDRFAFLGGTLRLRKNGIDLLSASIPVFSIIGTHPSEALSMFGVLGDIAFAPEGTSSWLDAFRAEVLDRPPLLPDFFILAGVDLIALSAGFMQPFDGVGLTAAGVVGNASVPEPPVLVLVVASLVAFYSRRRAVRTSRWRSG